MVKLTQGRTQFYTPPISEAWLHAAGQAGGRSAVVVGIAIWQRVKLDFNRHGGDPLGHRATITRKRVGKLFPMSAGAFQRALAALTAAGLVESTLDAAGQAYKVRIIPLPDEVTLTSRLLSWSTDRPRKRKHNRNE